MLKKSDFHEALQERGIHVGIGYYGRTQSVKGLQILKGSLFYFFYGCTLRKKRKKDTIQESILEEKIQEIYSQNRR